MYWSRVTLKNTCHQITGYLLKEFLGPKIAVFWFGHNCISFHLYVFIARAKMFVAQKNYQKTSLRVHISNDLVQNFIGMNFKLVQTSNKRGSMVTVRNLKYANFHKQTLWDSNQIKLFFQTNQSSCQNLGPPSDLTQKDALNGKSLFYRVNFEEI